MKKGGRLFFGALAGLLFLNVLLISLVSPVEATPRRALPQPAPAAPRHEPQRPATPVPPVPEPAPKPDPQEPDGEMPLGCLIWEDCEDLLYLGMEEEAWVRICLDLRVRP